MGNLGGSHFRGNDKLSNRDREIPASAGIEVGNLTINNSAQLIIFYLQLFYLVRRRVAFVGSKLFPNSFSPNKLLSL